MTSTNRYATSWESFWSTSTGAPGEIFWDADPAHAAQEDLALFQSHMDPKLTMIDLGCGNGTQTRFLADHFAKVIGTEISPAAVQIAQTKHAAPNASYRVHTAFLMCCVLMMPRLSMRKLAMRMSTCVRCCINCRPQIMRRQSRVSSGCLGEREYCILSNCRQLLNPTLPN